MSFRTLVIDDDLAWQASISSKLRSENIDCHCVRSWVEGQQEFKKTEPKDQIDLLILDLFRKGESPPHGISLLEHLRSEGLVLPTIILTEQELSSSLTRRAFAEFHVEGVFRKEEITDRAFGALLRELRESANDIGKGGRQIIDSPAAQDPPTLARALAILEEFGTCASYLRTRRARGGTLKLESEADVQDVIFTMLKPSVPDLIPESPIQKVASRYVIQDFVTKQLQLVIEAKFVRDQKHATGITKELNDDIEMYQHDPNCQTLVFFVYDPQGLIRDRGDVKRHIEKIRTFGGRAVQYFLIVKP